MRRILVLKDCWLRWSGKLAGSRGGKWCWGRNGWRGSGEHDLPGWARPGLAGHRVGAQSTQQAFVDLGGWRGA